MGRQARKRKRRYLNQEWGTQKKIGANKRQKTQGALPEKEGGRVKDESQKRDQCK